MGCAGTLAPPSRLRPKASLSGAAALGRASLAGCQAAQTHWLRLPTNLDPRRVPFVRRGAGRKARQLGGQGLRRADQLGPATARMADSRLFRVAEERSGHCAVVDGNFLYVWGGYVVRGRGGRGGLAPGGRPARGDAERPPTPARGERLSRPGSARPRRPRRPARPSAVGRSPSPPAA